MAVGDPSELPCDTDVLMNFNGDTRLGVGDELVHNVDVTDAMAILEYLFLQGIPHVLGKSCTIIEGCPDRCEL